MEKMGGECKQEARMNIVVVIQDSDELAVVCDIIQEAANEKRILVDLHGFWSPELALQYMGLGYQVSTGVCGVALTKKYAARDNPIIPDAIIADEIINCVGTQFHSKTLRGARFRKVPNYTLQTNSTRKLVLNSNAPLEPMGDNVKHSILGGVLGAFGLFSDKMNGIPTDHQIRILVENYISTQFPLGS